MSDAGEENDWQEQFENVLASDYFWADKETVFFKYLLKLFGSGEEQCCSCHKSRLSEGSNAVGRCSNPVAIVRHISCRQSSSKRSCSCCDSERDCAYRTYYGTFNNGWRDSDYREEKDWATTIQTRRLLLPEGVGALGSLVDVVSNQSALLQTYLNQDDSFLKIKNTKMALKIIQKMYDAKRFGKNTLKVRDTKGILKNTQLFSSTPHPLNWIHQSERVLQVNVLHTNKEKCYLRPVTGSETREENEVSDITSQDNMSKDKWPDVLSCCELLGSFPKDTQVVTFASSMSPAPLSSTEPLLFLCEVDKGGISYKDGKLLIRQDVLCHSKNFCQPDSILQRRHRKDGLPADTKSAVSNWQTSDNSLAYPLVIAANNQLQSNQCLRRRLIRSPNASRLLNNTSNNNNIGNVHASGSSKDVEHVGSVSQADENKPSLLSRIRKGTTERERGSAGGERNTPKKESVKEESGSDSSSVSASNDEEEEETEEENSEIASINRAIIEDDATAKKLDKSLKSSTGYTFLNILIIVWHVVVVLVSLALVAVGIALCFFFTDIVEHSVKTTVDLRSYSNLVRFKNLPRPLVFGDLTQVVGSWLIGVHTVYIGGTMLFITQPLHKIHFTLSVVIAVTFCAIMCEANFCNIYLAPESEANENAKKELKKRLQSEYKIYSKNEFSMTYDFISIWGQCCGVVDQYDFTGIELVLSLGQASSHQVALPPTCCRREVFRRGLSALMMCLDSSSDIYKVGCYEVIYNWIRDHSIHYHAVVILHIVDLFLYTLIYWRHLHVLQQKLVTLLHMERKKGERELTYDELTK
ncbi:uncharacterized protein LOC101854691 [Aplysia californica]|uniref:Uncharacterized protein LOC101854691 n=1 Tax=Aplysia californica TaxID=6500 RepID=A0ABM1AF50_APLCA|nr:uncharacterized protein LOC101854691 [Aplysia californica]